ncbi:MAG: hypothetical protein FVQ80_11255 [Planctomycetes bacterium]|nr:hypothetical protein [Planctomycetota bacterium]
MTEKSIEKKCDKCNVVYPATLEYFYKDKGGLRGKCKVCVREEAKVRAKSGYVCPGRKESLKKYNNSEKGTKTQRKYRRTEKGKGLSRRAKLGYYYNLTNDDYNFMFQRQEGCCKICNTHQSQLKRRLDIDHDHVTSKVRGLLCSPCNRQLGSYEHGKKFNPLFTERFVRYLSE